MKKPCRWLDFKINLVTHHIFKIWSFMFATFIVEDFVSERNYYPNHFDAKGRIWAELERAIYGLRPAQLIFDPFIKSVRYTQLPHDTGQPNPTHLTFLLVDLVFFFIIFYYIWPFSKIQWNIVDPCKNNSNKFITYLENLINYNPKHHKLNRYGNKEGVARDKLS